MCELDTDITPTKRAVYLRKSSKSSKTKSSKTKSSKTKSVKEDSATRIVPHPTSSSEETLEYYNRFSRKYILRCKAVGEMRKKGTKKDRCACGRGCDKDTSGGMCFFHCPAKDDKHKEDKKKAVFHFKVENGNDCHCNGGDKDGWLCDVCRAEEKKKGVLKFVARDCGSDSSSDCCNSCAESECDCSDDEARFDKECDAWMKAAKKQKNERKEAIVCKCQRPGCNVCVIVNC